MPWRKILAEEKNSLQELIEAGIKQFRGRLKVILFIANELKISDTHITESINLPLIDGDKELFAAIILQNLQHPKNHHRREAVVAKQYKEIRTSEQAQEFLSKLVAGHLKNEMAGRETQLRVTMQSA